MGRVYLTFNDHPLKNTPRILDILRDFDAKASFFLIGKSIENNYKLACAIRDEEHAIGNHSYNHTKFVDYNDILKCDMVLCKKLGVLTNYFRSPFEIVNEGVIKYLKQYTSTKLIKWTVNMEDNLTLRDKKIDRFHIIHGKKIFNSDYNLNILKTVIKSGDILLMHGFNDVTVTMLPKVLSYLKDKRFTFLTIDKL